MNNRRTLSAAVAALIAIGCGGSDIQSSAQGSTQPATNSCVAVQPVTELPPAPYYGDAVSDGHDVYFSGAGTLYRVPVSGGSVETVYTGPFGSFTAGGGVVAWLSLAPGSTNPAGLTVEDSAGTHSVVFPTGVLPAAGTNLVADAQGDIFFQVMLATGGRTHVWRWDPATSSAAEMPGVGMPDAGAGTNLYWANRGQLLWSNNLEGPAGGLYLTDIATGTPHQLTDNTTVGFGGLVGMDAKNVYGAASICPEGACPFTVYGVPRSGGPSFVAYQSSDAYWTNGLQADDSGLYWVDWKTEGIFHAALDPSGTAQRIVDQSGGVAQFALDACNVYWLGTDQTRTTRLDAIAK